MDHTNCHVEAETKMVDTNEIAKGAKAHLLVSGMGCENCANRVHNGLLQLNGVLEAIVELDTHQAHVTYDSAIITPQDLISAVRLAGINSNHNYQAALIN